MKVIPWCTPLSVSISFAFNYVPGTGEGRFRLKKWYIRNLRVDFQNAKLPVSIWIWMSAWQHTEYEFCIGQIWRTLANSQTEKSKATIWEDVVPKERKHSHLERCSVWRKIHCEWRSIYLERCRWRVGSGQHLCFPHNGVHCTPSVRKRSVTRTE